MTEFKELLGKTITNIEKNDDYSELRIKTECGKTYLMHHIQDCCESVYIEDICGDLDHLLNSPILVAEESSNDNEDLDGVETPSNDGDFKWTFYKLDTAKGGVTIRWFGGSNGYYCVKVDFVEIKKEVE